MVFPDFIQKYTNICRFTSPLYTSNQLFIIFNIIQLIVRSIEFANLYIHSRQICRNEAPPSPLLYHSPKTPLVQIETPSRLF